MSSVSPCLPSGTSLVRILPAFLIIVAVAQCRTPGVDPTLLQSGLALLGEQHPGDCTEPAAGVNLHGRDGHEWVRAGRWIAPPRAVGSHDSPRRAAVPSIPPNHVENGRLFHGYRKGMYMYPCDEVRSRAAIERANPLTSIGHVAREGPHGHPPQAFSRRAKGSITLGAPGRPL